MSDDGPDTVCCFCARYTWATLPLLLPMAQSRFSRFAVVVGSFCPQEEVATLLSQMLEVRMVRARLPFLLYKLQSTPLQEFPLSSYDLLERNCCHFADDFCRSWDLANGPNGPVPRCASKGDFMLEASRVGGSEAECCCV